MRVRVQAQVKDKDRSQASFQTPCTQRQGQGLCALATKGWDSVQENLVTSATCQGTLVPGAQRQGKINHPKLAAP